jgi:hypothetical protein
LLVKKTAGYAFDGLETGPSRWSNCSAGLAWRGLEYQNSHQIYDPEARPRRRDPRPVGRCTGPEHRLGRVLKVVGDFEKIATLLAEMLGLKVNRRPCAELSNTGEEGEPTYEGLIDIRASPVVYPDETGWKVGGHRLGFGPSPTRPTVYAIERGEAGQAAKVLGGLRWDSVPLAGLHRRFAKAALQTCLAHLLRRSSGMLETATRGAVGFGSRRGCPQDGAEAPGPSRPGTISLAAWPSPLTPRPDPAGTLHLSWESPFRRPSEALSGCSLRLPAYEGVEATNWPAEQDPPAMINERPRR